MTPALWDQLGKWGRRVLAVVALLAFYAAIVAGVWLLAQVDR